MCQLASKQLYSFVIGYFTSSSDVTNYSLPKELSWRNLSKEEAITFRVIFTARKLKLTTYHYPSINLNLDALNSLTRRVGSHVASGFSKSIVQVMLQCTRARDELRFSSNKWSERDTSTYLEVGVPGEVILVDS